MHCIEPVVDDERVAGGDSTAVCCAVLVPCWFQRIGLLGRMILEWWLGAALYLLHRVSHRTRYDLHRE
jgi:hypothetical protein